MVERTRALISIPCMYFSPVYAHIAGQSANCHCRTRLEQDALFYSRVPDVLYMYRATCMDEHDDNTCTRSCPVPSDKLLARITMSRAVRIALLCSCIFYHPCEFHDRVYGATRTVNDIYPDARSVFISFNVALMREVLTVKVDEFLFIYVNKSTSR